VALHEGSINDAFFEYARLVISSHAEDSAKQEEIATKMSTVISLCDAQRKLAEDFESFQAAGKNLSSILGAESLGDAEKQIDNLADAGQIDPSLVTMMAKAWAGAKESNMMKEEAKDIMFHLYNKARDGLSLQQPVELKILKYVTHQPTKREMKDALEAAFTPGVNYETSDLEYLSTTPEKLIKVVNMVLEKYEMNRMRYLRSVPGGIKTRTGSVSGGEIFKGMMKEASMIPGPNVIDKLREVRYLIRKEFLGVAGEEGELWMHE